jgi:hypothetical protein
MQRKAAAAEAAEAADSTMQPDQQQQQQQAELQQLQACVEACISSLSEVLNTALQRLKRLGLEGFAGVGEEGSVLQLVEWLSTSSYNTGIMASREQQAGRRQIDYWIIVVRHQRLLLAQYLDACVLCCVDADDTHARPAPRQCFFKHLLCVEAADS